MVPDESPAPPRAPMGDVHRPTTRPGHLLPHAWLEVAGRRQSTLDLTGTTGFALLAGPAGAPWCEAATQVAEKYGIAITVVRVGGAEDTDGRWAAVRGIADDGAVLVRPDHHVAWRSTGGSDNPADALDEALAQILNPGR